MAQELDQISHSRSAPEASSTHATGTALQQSHELDVAVVAQRQAATDQTVPSSSKLELSPRPSRD